MTVWETSVTAIRTLMKMDTRTTWTTAHTFPTPTRLTMTRMARETPVTMMMTTTASLMTRTTADWPSTLTNWTLMVSKMCHVSTLSFKAQQVLGIIINEYVMYVFQVMVVEMLAKMTLTKTTCLTSTTFVPRTLTLARQISASSRWFLWTPKAPRRLIPTGSSAIRAKSWFRLSTATLASLLVSKKNVVRLSMKCHPKSIHSMSESSKLLFS